jgi:hypothetical protein
MAPPGLMERPALLLISKLLNALLPVKFPITPPIV